MEQIFSTSTNYGSYVNRKVGKKSAYGDDIRGRTNLKKELFVTIQGGICTITGHKSQKLKGLIKHEGKRHEVQEARIKVPN